LPTNLRENPGERTSTRQLLGGREGDPEHLSGFPKGEQGVISRGAHTPTAYLCGVAHRQETSMTDDDFSSDAESYLCPRSATGAETGMNQELGERLRRERLRRKERQEETAERFGVSQPNYSRWENGEYRVSQGHFAKVAEFLGLTVAEVWTMANSEEPPTSLEMVRQEIDALKRDISDLRGQIGTLGQIVARLEEALPKPKAKPASPRPAPVKAKKAAGKTTRRR
jgi:transcriptional regulator with XRE-family HTH domain